MTTDWSPELISHYGRLERGTVSDIQKAKARLMLASFELGQAQRALEGAEETFRKALNEVDFLEDQVSPPAKPKHMQEGE